MTAYRKHQIDQSSYLALLQDINVLTDVCGACERIKKTPIPYTYNIFIKKFIFIYILTMPLAFMGEFRYWTILVTVFTFYTLTSLELIAETIDLIAVLNGRGEDRRLTELCAVADLAADR